MPCGDPLLIDSKRIETMIYSEAAYFDGYHVAHCAARDEHLRIERKRNEARKAFERRSSRC